MAAAARSGHDPQELEALFDSIVAAGTSPDQSPAPAAAAPEASAPAAAGTGDGGSPAEMLAKIGKLTRALHDTLRQLGLDRSLQQAAATIPDSRDRLAYVATLTEKAAERALNATEAARPLQQALADEARELSVRWDRLFDQQLSVDEFRALVGDTRRYLGTAPDRAEATCTQLTEIMMAQDFQDLTGQVIKKVTEAAHEVEDRLLALLVEQLPPHRRTEADGLLNGPVVNGAGRSDVVTSQDQVDSLLESLGF